MTADITLVTQRPLASHYTRPSARHCGVRTDLDEPVGQMCVDCGGMQWQYIYYQKFGGDKIKCF